VIGGGDAPAVIKLSVLKIKRCTPDVNLLKYNEVKPIVIGDRPSLYD